MSTSLRQQGNEVAAHASAFGRAPRPTSRGTGNLTIQLPFRSCQIFCCCSGMEQECQKLRLELKEWEKSFAAANGGKKAGREDIKQHPEIGT